MPSFGQMHRGVGAVVPTGKAWQSLLIAAANIAAKELFPIVAAALVCGGASRYGQTVTTVQWWM